ncbi:hypothetical protein Tco_0212535 [Tanacetum coccineum]
MSTIQFADTHNMVAFVEKPTESVGFKQIVDFLNPNPIKYALTINPTIYTSCIKQFWATAKAKTINGEVQLQALVDGKKIIIIESTVRRDLQLEDAEVLRLLHGMSLVAQLVAQLICFARQTRSLTIQYKGYIFDSMVKNLDNVSGKFLMYPRVESSEHEESLGEEDASKQRRKIAGIDADAGITFKVADTAEIHGEGRVLLMVRNYCCPQFKKKAAKDHPRCCRRKLDSVPVSAAGGETTVITEVKITLAQALAELKSAKPMTNKELIIQESEETTTKTTTIVPFQKSKDKGKAIMIEHEVPLKKKSQERADEESARKLLEQFDEEVRLAKEAEEKVEEANIAWDNIQEKIEADYQMTEQLQAQEREELTIKDKSKLYVQLLENRRKFFVYTR